ncbi:hypothetical protein BH11MYX2_BH11MYX2_32490 [soil metagenome]
MRKKLTVIGNSVALIIDKPLRRLMELAPSLEVDVRFDGARLIVEAVSAPAANANTQPAFASRADGARLPLAMVLDAGRVARTLVEQFDMSPEYLVQLYPGVTRLARYLGWAGNQECVRTADATQAAVVRRMHLCWEQLVLGRSWAETIAVALHAVPLSDQSGSNVVSTTY